MKVLVMFQCIPDEVKLMVVDMTSEEFQELLPAHDHFLGQCLEPSSSAIIEQSLCKVSMAFDARELCDQDKEWMTDEGVDHSWFNRFEGRIAKVESPHTPINVQAFLTTGYLM